MHINKIKIHNFKSIYDELELDFNTINGIWKISGQVGAGKTTIGEAIIFGLFGSVNGKNNPDLISWGKKHGLVELWCTSLGKNIYIKRELNTFGQSPIYVEIDGEELVFTNKRDAQLQLEHDYYDTSKTTLELLCIISFNNFKSLATLNTQDTKKFLDQVLGFSLLTEYSDVCKKFKSENQLAMRDIQTEISNIKSQIYKIEELSDMERIDGDMSVIKENVMTLDNMIKELIKDCNTNRDRINNDIKKKNSELTKITTLGKKLAKEISFIEKGVCPTCGASIDQSHLEDKKAERELLLNNYNIINDSIHEVENGWNKYFEEYNIKLNKLKQDKDLNNSELAKLQEQERRLNININEISNLRVQIDNLEKDLVMYQKEDAEWEALYNILSTTVRAEILKSFIPMLNKNILKYTQRLQQPYIIQFDSNFKCNISLCGLDKEISISSLSTGQLKVVDMIIILGILGTVMGSNGINIIFLDELFSNLDVKLRNEMCMVLRENITKETSMFIISHTDLEDKYFDGDIHMKLELKDKFEKHSTANIIFYNNNTYI